eukprot:3769660-Lingulodinium_polyedra.AAC.1
MSGRWRCWAMPSAGGRSGAALGLQLLGGWPWAPRARARAQAVALEDADEALRAEALWSPPVLQA